MARGDTHQIAARNSSGRGVADWLCLAAAPTFALMAVLTCVADSGVMCSASPVSGMATMYLLMATFHTSPWLKLITNRP